ncbi:hypothetical protein LCGC14_2950290, partial [marine sediment metagenome]
DEVFRVENGQLVPVPELGGFPGIDPAVTAAEQVRQFGVTQAGLNRRNVLSTTPGFLTAANQIRETQRQILSSGGDVVLRRFGAAGEPPPPGIQTFTQADQLRGFNVPSLLNQFSGFAGTLGFGGQTATAPSTVVDSRFVGGPAGPDGLTDAERQARIDAALAVSQAEADAAAAAAAAPAATAAPAAAGASPAAASPAIIPDTTLPGAPNPDDPLAVGSLPRFAHGGQTRGNQAIVGESTDGQPNPELVNVVPDGRGGFTLDVRPLDQLRAGGRGGFNRPSRGGLSRQPLLGGFDRGQFRGFAPAVESTGGLTPLPTLDDPLQPAVGGLTPLPSLDDPIQSATSGTDSTLLDGAISGVTSGGLRGRLAARLSSPST